MALNFGQIALAAVGGAAKQFNIDRETLRKEYSKKKDRQQQWADGPGRTVLARLEQDSNEALDAGETLINYGMNKTELKYLIKTHKPRSLITLAAELKKLNATELTALKNSGKLNEVIQVADDFEPSEEEWAKSVVKNFRGPELTPRQREESSKGFLAGLLEQGSEKYYRDELDEFEDDEFVVGSDGESYSIRELKAAASYVPERGTVAPFDLSAIGGRGKNSEWNNVKKLIVDKASMAIRENGTDAEKMAFIANTEEDGEDNANYNERLQNLRGDTLKKYLEEATRDVYGNEELKNAFTNPFAAEFYGGQDALDAILNPISLEDAFAATGIEMSDLKEFATDEEAIVFFKKYPANWVLVDGAIAKRPKGLTVVPGETQPVEPGAAQPVEPGSFDEDLTLKAQPTVKVDNIPTRPEPEYRNDPPRMFEQPKNKRKIRAWDDQYGSKYNPDATYKLVKPQGPRPEDVDSREFYEYELWGATFGDTHDPLTGYPLIDNINLSLIPGTPEFEEAKRQGTPE